MVLFLIGTKMHCLYWLWLFTGLCILYLQYHGSKKTNKNTCLHIKTSRILLKFCFSASTPSPVPTPAASVLLNWLPNWVLQWCFCRVAWKLASPWFPLQNPNRIFILFFLILAENKLNTFWSLNTIARGKKKNKKIGVDKMKYTTVVWI